MAVRPKSEKRLPTFFRDHHKDHFVDDDGFFTKATQDKIKTTGFLRGGQ